MKKITTLFFSMLLTLGVVNAQDITAFDFDGVNPTFTDGGDTFVSVANPLSDAVNNSANVGQLTHNGQYNSGSSITVDIDPGVYNSFTMSVYSPNTKKGKVEIQFIDASGNPLGWYEQAVTDSTKWINFTRNLVCTKKIAKIAVFSNSGTVSTGTAKDIVYFDNLVYKKSIFNTLYGESFYTPWSLYADWTGAPSTKVGSWFGGVDMQTAGDATMTLPQWWGESDHILKLTSTDAAVIIPDINVAGYDSLKISYDIHDEAAKAIIDVKVGSGDWVSVVTSSQSWSWTWKTFVLLLKDATGNPISNVSTISLRFSQPPSTDALYYDNVKVLGKVHDSGTTTSLVDQKSNILSVYPNPATNYILTKNAQKVTVFDLNGSIVKESFNTEKVDVSLLAKGTYIVKVKIDNVTKIGKLIKE